jgi:putative transposase
MCHDTDMARKIRESSGGKFYHVLNRANARFKIFQQDSDYKLFEQVLIEAASKFSIDILTHNNMPNHFHLVIYSQKNEELPKFMKWLSTTFVQRWHLKHDTIGTGHLFQGRYKSFPIKYERHLLQVLFYVDRNAVRAGLVKKAQEWRWSSVWIRIYGNEKQKELLSLWPIEIPMNYLDIVNKKDKFDDLKNIRFSIEKSVEIDSGNVAPKRGRPKKNGV